ncbi:hypothetical protein BDZ89DRAFT_1240193 [Hymenopellis radicata]|nr:hypothetical protein BDZ89DRAFT_1240193 [Hymenopellis radicata]
MFGTTITSTICQSVELLACTVRLIANPDVMPNEAHWTVNLDFLCSVITVIQDGYVTSLWPEKNNWKAWVSCLFNIQEFYYRSSKFLTPIFHFPRLEFLLQTWAGFYDCLQYDSDFKDGVPMSNLWMPMDIMANVLSRGHKAAYRIFRDKGWMGIIFTEWVICGVTWRPVGDFPNRVLVGCLEGLYTLTPDSNRRKFCEYLHQPQQLVLSFMLIVAASASEPDFTLDDSRDLVVRLAKICPTHTSWKDCDTELKAILAWARTPNAETSLFPWPRSLQNLSATAAFRKYPLVERTARRFSSRKMREELEICLETLHTILENAEHVEGVWIPDLETQTSIAAALLAESQISSTSDGD